MCASSKPTRSPASRTTANGDALTRTASMPAARARSTTDVHLAVQPRPGGRTASTTVAGESAHLVSRPAGEAPRHELAHAVFGIGPFEVRRVNPARDLRAVPGIREGVVTSHLPEGLERRGLDAPVLQKRVKEVVAHVAAPERAVAVGGDDAAGALAGQRLDSRPDVVGGLLLHVASISDRMRPGLD